MSWTTDAAVQARLDRDGQIERARTSADLGLDTADVTLIDARGDRTVLVHVTQKDNTKGFVIDVLGVLRFDERWRILQATQFDAEEIASARAELDAMAERETP